MITLDDKNKKGIINSPFLTKVVKIIMSKIGYNLNNHISLSLLEKKINTLENTLNTSNGKILCNKNSAVVFDTNFNFIIKETTNNPYKYITITLNKADYTGITLLNDPNIVIAVDSTADNTNLSNEFKGFNIVSFNSEFKELYSAISLKRRTLVDSSTNTYKGTVVEMVGTRVDLNYANNARVSVVSHLGEVDILSLNGTTAVGYTDSTEAGDIDAVLLINTGEDPITDKELLVRSKTMKYYEIMSQEDYTSAEALGQLDEDTVYSIPEKVGS